jgi:hypothetical protein
VPSGFDTWFAKAASRDPAQRFASAGEMARSLERVVSPGQMRVTLDSVSMDAIPIPSMGPAGDSLEGTEVVASGAKKRPAALFGGVAVAAVAVLVGIGVAVRGGHAPAAAAEPTHRTAALAQAPAPVQAPVATQTPAVAATQTAPQAPPEPATAAPAEAPATNAPAADNATADEPPAGARRLAKTAPAKKKVSGHGKASSDQGGSFDPLQMRR